MIWLIASLLFVQGFAQHGYYYAYPSYDRSFTTVTTLSPVYPGHQHWSSSASRLPWYGSGIQPREDQDPPNVYVRDDWNTGYGQIAVRQEPGKAAAALPGVNQGQLATDGITSDNIKGRDDYWSSYYGAAASPGNDYSGGPGERALMGTPVADGSTASSLVGVTESDGTAPNPGPASSSSPGADGSTGGQPKDVSATGSKTEPPAEKASNDTTPTPPPASPSSPGAGDSTGGQPKGLPATGSKQELPAKKESKDTTPTPPPASPSSPGAGDSTGGQPKDIPATGSKQELPAKKASNDTTPTPPPDSPSSSQAGGSSAPPKDSSKATNSPSKSTSSQGSKVARRSHSDASQVSHGFNFGYLKVQPIYRVSKASLSKQVYNTASAEKDCLRLLSETERRNCIKSAGSITQLAANHNPTHGNDLKVSKYYDDVCFRRGSDCSSCLQDFHCSYCPADKTCYSSKLVGAALFDSSLCHHQSPKYFKMCSYDSHHVIYVITSLVLILVLMTAAIIGLSLKLYFLRKKGRTFDYFDLS